MRHLTAGIVLVLLWVALWGDLTAANVIGGGAIAAVVVAVSPTTGSLTDGVVVHPWGLFRLAVYFLRQLIVASLLVAALVVRPRAAVTSGIVAVPLTSESPVLTTVVANMVSLTPGTLTLEVDGRPPVLFVHVLHLTDIEKVRADVRRLEERVVRALGSRAATSVRAVGHVDGRTR